MVVREDMAAALRYGKTTWHYDTPTEPEEIWQPTPVLQLKPVWAQGKSWEPRLKERTLLLLLKRVLPKKVSFARAWAGFKSGSQQEEKELGEDRAFYRWLQRHELSILWHKGDLELHPYFYHASAPQHDPRDEMAKGMCFAVAPVTVQNRPIKLYLQDHDVLTMLRMSYGTQEDFLQLVGHYVEQRLQWILWKAPAPGFLDWLTSQGKRPAFRVGQLGFTPPTKAAFTLTF